MKELTAHYRFFDEAGRLVTRTAKYSVPDNLTSKDIESKVAREIRKTTGLQEERPGPLSSLLPGRFQIFLWS